MYHKQSKVTNWNTNEIIYIDQYIIDHYVMQKHSVVYAKPEYKRG